MKLRIAVITGFHQSPRFLKSLFECLNKQTYTHFDVFVYNHKYSSLTDLLKEDYFFTANLVKLDKNEGFAGGNNLAIKYASEKFNYAYYALINDDTKPSEDWLFHLVSTAVSDPLIGAVTSKILYYEPYVIISGQTETNTQNDPRNLGIRWYHNTRFTSSIYPKPFYLKGFYDREVDDFSEFRWSSSDFEIALPIQLLDKDDTLRLFIRKNSKIKNQKLTLAIGTEFKTTITLTDDQYFYPVKIPISIINSNLKDILQNAGSDYDNNYNGFDIGSGEIDKGQYNKIRDVRMFCGCSVLLSNAALKKTGLFADYFFSYYEDSDLSLRLIKTGFKIKYQPLSITRHYHAASGKEWSPFFTYHVFRNKIIFCAKNLGLNASILSFKERVKETILFLNWARKQKFQNKEINQRVRLNIQILIDAVKGIIRYKPSKL